MLAIPSLLLDKRVSGNSTPLITTSEYQLWEIRRHVEPSGQHGFFTVEAAV